jgi:hypothetical protein
MSQYSLRNVFRRLDRALLIQYLEKRPAAQRVVAALQSNDLSAAFSHLDELPETDRARLEAELRYVHDLSTEAGLLCIHHEIASRRKLGLTVSLPSDFDTLEGFEDRILCAVMNDPHLVAVAALFLHADSLSERSWRRFDEIPQRSDLHLTGQMGSQIADGIRGIYSADGRARRVTAERYIRNGQHYVFVFADDYSTIRIEHADDDSLQRRAARPTFEIVFVYDASSGTLDVFARGNRKTKNNIARLFVDTVFGPDIALAPRKPTYNVDLLRHRATSLPVDRNDGVSMARVRRLRLCVARDRTQKITFEVPAIGKEKDVYDLMDEHLDHPPSDARYEVSQAEIQFFMLPEASSPTAKAYSFTLTAPDHCSVRNLPEAIQAVAHKYLRAWGVSGS